MPEEWKVLSSRIELDDEWLRVRSDRCVAPDGHIVEPYYILEYPDWVNVVALTADGQTVLAREYRHAAGRVVTGLVSGRVEVGEDPLDAAKRELREETGCAGTFTLLGSYWSNPAMNSNRVWAYLATDVETVAEVAFDPNEEIEVVQLPFLEFLRDSFSGNVDDQGLHLAALYLALPYMLRRGIVELADLPGALGISQEINP